MVAAASERSALRLAESRAAPLLAARRGCVRDVAYTTMKRLRGFDSDRLQCLMYNGKIVANYMYGASNCLATLKFYRDIVI